jgi:hypothetical protein
LPNLLIAVAAVDEGFVFLEYDAAKMGKEKSGFSE